MKKFFYPLWVAALAASMWVGCAKNSGNSSGGGGGGGSNAPLQSATYFCASAAINRRLDPFAVCVDFRSGNCPSMREYVMYNGMDDFNPPPPYQGQCYDQNPMNCDLNEISWYQQYWVNYVGNAYRCTPADREAILRSIRGRINELNSQTYVPPGYNSMYPNGGQQYPTYGYRPYGFM